MNVIEMTSDEIDNVLRVVTAILNLGNVNYIPDPAAQGEDKVKVGKRGSTRQILSTSFCRQNCYAAGID